ncbi:hypothetical protein [Falsarthrobacter nasiphocae]|uniref:Uncharacterized protein n=1 Tax=Falsarthrobacter nasiphocae TaxID=189863 RepID=A0AAE4C5U2_9MICC|nr:hypothetical protein [Falsarthrobacter nasiphocae]MDR6892656.1 hypothetical protein [Falsarthrobacter nasiphocae]
MKVFAKVGVAAVLTASLSVYGVGLGATPAYADAQMSSAQAASDTAFDMEELEVYQALSFVNSIPDEVLESGDAATRAWAQAALSEENAGSWFGCSMAVAKAVAGVAVPAAKILKLKRLVSAVGGVGKAVDQIRRTKGNLHIAKQMGSATYDLVKIFFGIDKVERECFS